MFIAQKSCWNICDQNLWPKFVKNSQVFWIWRNLEMTRHLFLWSICLSIIRLLSRYCHADYYTLLYGEGGDKWPGILILAYFPQLHVKSYFWLSLWWPFCQFQSKKKAHRYVVIVNGVYLDRGTDCWACVFNSHCQLHISICLRVVCVYK